MMIGLDAILAAAVTAEPAPNGPTLFNNILSCFSEKLIKTTSHAAKACTEETRRHGIKELGYNWDSNTRTLSEAKDLLSRKISAETYYRKWPSSTVLQLKFALPALPHICSF